ncbi:MAG: hypothetical protein ACLFTK_03070 [Anaerolineales bacterium]
MMELSYFLQICVFFFAVIGYLRGFYREFVALAGILLGLFVLTEFDIVIDLLIGGGGARQRYLVTAVLLIALTYFAYEQAPVSFAPRAYRRARGVNLPGADTWRERTLGAVVGAFNGYLVVGSLWYFMDQLEYPLEPLFMQPLVGTTSADFVTLLPLVWLQEGNLLLWLVVGLFLLVIVFR